ncbi:alpha-1D adrenergic receptor, partial [Pteropus vampyrus]|uniref:Alpha-1D adrenergic receptor n=1 Tax=Pteropus vampyrus TaxID=132908 RepID=A0A6P3R0G1_PTEVA
GAAGAGGEVNGTAAVGGLVVSAQGVGVGVFLAAFILIAVAGNLLVILSVACNRHLQTVTNYFIVNLAVADLLLSTTVLPFSATMEVLGFWAFGRAFCDVWAAVDVLCCTASILSLCTISVDRYVGVRHSLKYPAIMTERKAAAILALLWAVALVVSVGPLLGWKEPVPPDERFCSITEEAGYAVFSSVCSFYLPMAVIVVMYCRVYVVARSTTRSLEAGVKRERGKASEVVLRIHCRGATSGADGTHGGMRSTKGHTFRSSLSVRLLKFSREKKAAKTLAIVVGVFVLCWFPFFFVLPLAPGVPLALTAPSAPGTPEVQAPVAGRRKPPCAFREWRLLGPFRRPTTQLRAKVSSLSHKIRAGNPQRAEAACALRSEVEAVSLGVSQDVAEGATCQAYELTDYSNLRETDI